MGVAVLPRVLMGDVWAARKTTSAIVARCSELTRCDGAATPIHPSCVEAHRGPC